MERISVLLSRDLFCYLFILQKQGTYRTKKLESPWSGSVRFSNFSSYYYNKYGRSLKGSCYKRTGEFCSLCSCRGLVIYPVGFLFSLNVPIDKPFMVLYNTLINLQFPRMYK